MSEVQTPAVPNFPLPTPEYTPASIIKLENVLRLYLNQLTNNVEVNTKDISSLTVVTWIGNGGGIFSG